MKVQNVMTTDVRPCNPDANLAVATEILWTNDCGVLPVVEDGGKVIGLITDRDICIAVGTKNQLPSEIPVSDAMSPSVYACAPDDDIHIALRTMQQARVRRLPVVSTDGMLQGILSLSDIALNAQKGNGKKTRDLSYDDFVETLKAICERRIQAQTELQQTQQAVNV